MEVLRSVNIFNYDTYIKTTLALVYRWGYYRVDRTGIITAWQ